STDNNDDTDTRFQPPLDTNNQNIHPIAEGYRIASTEILSPAISVSINKEPSHERHKRDGLSDNSSTPAVALQSTTLSNNDTDDDSIISDEVANAWARSLSLSPTFDGSGTEYESKLFISIRK